MFPMKPGPDTVLLGLLAWFGVLLMWIGWTGRGGDVLAALLAPGGLRDSATAGTEATAGLPGSSSGTESTAGAGL